MVISLARLRGLGTIALGGKDYQKKNIIPKSLYSNLPRSNYSLWRIISPTF